MTDVSIIQRYEGRFWLEYNTVQAGSASSISPKGNLTAELGSF